MSVKTQGFRERVHINSKGDTMRRNNVMRNMGLFPKLFITIIIITSIPIIISSVIIHQISTNNLENEINRSNLDVINQLKMTGYLIQLQDCRHKLLKIRQSKDF
jgi:hypothetical protein